MKATPLLINWHDEHQPVYSAHFEPHGKGRLATAGGDNHVRLWKIDADGEDRRVEYLSTLSKHSQSVNVVRWAPRGELLASAGDDGVVCLWVPSETHQTAFGEDGLEDKETWRVKHMCRSSGAEIYDLAWSPDGHYFIIGSMDNIGRIYNAGTGQLVRQIAEHNHYVQGVAWDPLNEYVATQSSDRSVHIYSLKTKDGHFTLEQAANAARVANHAKIDFPGSSRRISSNSPAPPDFGIRPLMSGGDSAIAMGSPVPSAPGTPNTLALPMNPPSVVSHSRRSSFGSSPSMRRSASPAPSLPLPAVMSMEASPKPYTGLGVKNANLYANETLTSFFRRLTFTPDGSLLLTPAGQYTNQNHSSETGKTIYDVINTVYIYTRGGINKPPVAHLPGHKKPSVVVKCSPQYYTIRKAPPPTKHITIDTSSKDGDLLELPEPVVSARASPQPSVMDPPPLVSQSSDLSRPTSEPKKLEVETNAASAGPPLAFSLPYRMVYAVATQDSVLLYDTQQQTPLCVVSNLHCATFTDLTWSNDGQTLIMTSSDGFCSTLTFAVGELGEIYHSEANPPPKHGHSHSLSSQNTPLPTPTSTVAPASPFPSNNANNGNSAHQRTPSNPMSIAPSPPPMSTSAFVASARPSSPTRSNSTSSIATQSSFVPPNPNSSTTAPTTSTTVVSNPTLVSGNVPSITAASSSFGGMSMTTPPQTPRSAASSVSGVKRDAGASESEKEDGFAQQGPSKKRRVAPTLVSDLSGAAPKKEAEP